MVDLLSYVSFQSVLSEWCNKRRGMYYPVCGMVHMKDQLLLIGKSIPCREDSGFPLSLHEWFFITCPMPYNPKYSVLSVSLNKHVLRSIIQGRNVKMDVEIPIGITL